MKQKKIGDILYVFSTTAYQITQDTDAAVIKIQQECIPAYAALNASLVSKFQPINYKLFCVRHPEWADYYNDYTVIIYNIIGEGTVTATPNSGDEGEEITLVASPTTGWEFTSWFVQTVKKAQTITVTDNKFLMPADDVKVQARFDKIDFTITVDDQIQNGTLSAPATANLGDTITITATPASGYALDTLTVMCGDVPVTVANNQFTMPAGDVTVTGTFVQAVVPYDEQYFTIESEHDNNSITINTYSSSSDNNHFYVSFDNGESWTESTYNQGADYITNITLNTGDKILIKRNCGYFNPATDVESMSDPIFNATYDFKVYGNVMSLIYGDDFANKTTFPSESSQNLMGLFAINDKLTDASNLILPAATLADKCYKYMFQGCTELTTAPALPATTLTDECYEYMFEGCTSLRSITMLATTLGDLGSNNALYYIVMDTYTDDTPYEQKNGKMYVSSSLSDPLKSDISEQLMASQSYDYWTIEDYAS